MNHKLIAASLTGLALAGTVYSVSQAPKEPQAQVETVDCKIKGNVSASGEKIYHMPSDQYYDVTEIDRSNGERWFCSPEEAKNAGWRHSKR
jgi:micrococcal nuclease